MEPWAGSPDIDPLRVVRIPEHNRVARTSTDGTQPKPGSQAMLHTLQHTLSRPNNGQTFIFDDGELFIGQDFRRLSDPRRWKVCRAGKWIVEGPTN